MLRGKKLIAIYVIQGALPYVVLSLVLLTAILFTQQTGRFAELAIYTDLPLSLAILIDTSASEERTLPDEKEAARAFLENVLRPNKDEAAVV